MYLISAPIRGKHSAVPDDHAFNVCSANIAIHAFLSLHVMSLLSSLFTHVFYAPFVVDDIILLAVVMYICLSSSELFSITK